MASKTKNMKKLMLFLSVAFLGQVATAQSDIEALERQRFEAQVKKDYAFLEKVLADDLLYTHSSGKTDTKTSYIQSIREGKSVYDKVEVEEISVRTYHKKTAVVNGQILISNANSEPARLRYAVVYVKNKKHGWQLVMWQSLKMSS